MHVMLIDGNSILNRSFYGIRPLTNREGLHTNAIYGFLSTYFKLIEDLSPNLTIVCFDVKGKTFRHQQFDYYKAARKGMPSELAEQVPVLKSLLDAMGLYRFEQMGYEADDLLGTLSLKLSNAGHACTIVTGDRDSLQLIGEHVRVHLITSSKQKGTVHTTYDTQLFMDTYGIPPHALIDLKSLMGDTSDGITGIAGVGEKTALPLLQRFGSLNAIYQNIEDPAIPAKLKNKLIEGEQSARDSYWLATIDRFVPLEFDIASLSPRPPQKEALLSLLDTLEFHSFTDRLLPTDRTDTSESVEDMPLSFQVICDLSVFSQKLKAHKTDLRYLFASEDVRLLGVLLTDTVMICKQSDFTNTGWQHILQTLFAGTTPYVLHDAREAFATLFEKGIVPSGLTFDTALAAYLIDAMQREYTLPMLSLRYLNQELPELPDCKTWETNSDTLHPILAQWLQTTQKLHAVLLAELESLKLMSLYQDVELPLIAVLAHMQAVGCYIDKAQLQAFGDMLQTKIAQLQSSIYAQAGERFNIQSTKELAHILFEKLAIPTRKKTKTGYSTNASVLESLAFSYPICADLLEYRKLTKLYSTYVVGLQKDIRDSDSRIHSHFQQMATATGRISSTNPNLQNIPIRTELGSELRKMFSTPTQDTVLIDADYSQIELRILAHLSGDPNMIEAFKQGKDIHTATASQIFHVPIELVTPEMRSRCKAVNFGIIYGISEFSLAGDLSISIAEATDYMHKYFATYPKIQAYLESLKTMASNEGYVETLFGRRRYLPALSTSGFHAKNRGERVAMNAPMQGTAADIVKIAMVRIWQRLQKEHPHAHLILQVHDELIIEAPTAEQTAVMQLLQEEMEHACTLRVPLVADAKVGHTWYEAH